MRLVMRLTDEANAFIAQAEPWKLAKQEETLQEAHQACSIALNILRF